jgi:hypothetical protein
MKKDFSVLMFSLYQAETWYQSYPPDKIIPSREEIISAADIILV